MRTLSSSCPSPRHPSSNASRRFHAELSLGVSDSDLLQLIDALASASSFASRILILAAPLAAVCAVAVAAAGALAAAGRRLLQHAPETYVSEALACAEPVRADVGSAAAVEVGNWERLRVAGALPSYRFASAEFLTPMSVMAGANCAEVVDCAADGSTGILGHHSQVLHAALRAFVDGRAPPMPFGLLFMKPTAQRLCRRLERAAANAAAEAGVEAAAKAAKAAGAKVGSAAAVGMAAALLQSVGTGRGGRRPPRQLRARLVLSTTDAIEAALRLCLIRHAQFSSQKSSHGMQVPVVLLVGEHSARGHSWLMQGLPICGLRLQVAGGRRWGRQPEAGRTRGCHGIAVEKGSGNQ